MEHWVLLFLASMILVCLCCLKGVGPGVAGTARSLEDITPSPHLTNSPKGSRQTMPLPLSSLLPDVESGPSPLCFFCPLSVSGCCVQILVCQVKSCLVLKQKYQTLNQSTLPKNQQDHKIISEAFSLLIHMTLKVKVKVAQSCLSLCNPMDYTVHGIFQARILEWVAVPFSRGSSQPRDRTQVSCIAGRYFTS